MIRPIPGFLLALALSFPVHAAIFVVNSTGDAGDSAPGNGSCATAGSVCTFRAALQEANALAGTDTIHFGIAGMGPHTITPATPLPISSNMLIDGTTQLGSGAGPFILLDGQNTIANGLEFTSGTLSVTIQGLAIGGFTTAGIRATMSGATITIKNCNIGVGTDGLTALPNGDGILARVTNTGAGSLIIGDASGNGNVISGNADFGIEIEDASTAGAKISAFTVQGNKIGVGSDGLTAVPNASGGIRVDGQFGAIGIGGSIAGRNVISGNGGGGFLTRFFFQADTMIFAQNYVGVAADGVTARGNNGIGAQLVAKQYAIDSNFIANNTSTGLSLNTGLSASTIRGNRIEANGGAGILINSHQTTYTIGGPGATDANIITGNAGKGIVILDGPVEVAENSIYANGSIGIDLGNDGVTPNDALDADAPAYNNGQNFPTLTSAARAGGTTFINAGLSAAASQSYNVRFFSSTSPDPTGFGEGQTYLGATTVTTNASGNVSFTFTCTAAEGTHVTATATRVSTAETSEFSNAVLVAGPQQFRLAQPSYATGESGNVVITVERINGSTGAASVDYTAEPGSAFFDDFAAGSGTVNFANGQTTQTVSIAITADTLDESLESFAFFLSNPSTGTELGSPTHATIHITDDDPEPSILISDPTAAENATPMMFNVTLSPASGRAVTVDYLTGNGSAIAGSDYAASAGTVTFAAGETAKTILVPIVDDSGIEVTETFNVTLSNPTFATITDATGAGTITDDDGMPAITIDDVGTVEGEAATFTVSLSGPSASTVVVNWSTSSGDATIGSDYVAASGLLTFAPGELTKTIVIDPIEDVIVEASETFYVDLAGPANATLADAQGGATIADDDGTPSLTVNDPAVVEGVNATFTITLAPASASAVTVTYATGDGSAASSSDYAAQTDTLTFAAGETSKTVDVSTTSDSVAEASEQFTVSLSSPAGATIADATGTGTIIDDDGEPRVTIGNDSDSEGNTTLAFTIDLSHASSSSIEVTWTTADDTASAGGDYSAAGSTITFAPGETSKTVDVTIAEDGLVEEDETFFVRITGATNAIVTDDQGVGTITNDDGAVSVSIQDVSADEDTGTFAFAVTLNAQSAETVNVQWASMDQTASAGSDYTAGAGGLVFAPGETSKDITITVAPDSTFEPNETFAIHLLGATHATLADAQALGTILNDDAAPAVPLVSIAPAGVAEGDAGTAPLTFAVTLSGPTVNTVMVSYATGGGGASAGADYVSASGTLTFAPGVTSQNLTVNAIGDELVEGDESFVVTLSAPSNATLGTAAANGTILDDDVAPAVPAISIAPASAVEGNAGSSPVTFTVTLDVPTVSTVLVTYATSNGTATAGADYAATNGTLTFLPGVTSRSIDVAVVGDSAVEGNETFAVTLSAPSNAILGTAGAIGTILDDDTAPAVPSISIAPAATAEGNAGSTPLSFAVTLSVPTVASVSVSYATSDGSATAGTDYAATNGTLTFSPGVTSQNIVVPVIGDNLIEGNETMVVTLSAPSNAILGTAGGNGTILDDDTAPAVPVLSIASASATEGHAGSTPMTFAVTLNVPTVVNVTVDFATSNGSATGGADFAATNGTLTFSPGVTSQNIVVPVIGDTLVEGNEILTVTLSSPASATLGSASASGTIVDDDSLPVVPAITIGDVSRDEGDAGATVFAFPVTLNVAGTAAVSVQWATSGGSDIVAASGTLAFAPGMTSQTVFVSVHGDEIVESDETFTVQLSAPVNATLADATGTGTIRNDDQSSPAAPTLRVADVTVVEGNEGSVAVRLALTLSSRAAGGASVRWMTRGATATGGADYTEASGRATFGSGTTTATLTLSVLGDPLDESDETFVVELFDADGATLRDERATVTIVDDDTPPALRAIVLAVGSLRGNNGSRFGTAVQMVNFTGAPAEGNLVIRPAGTSDSTRDVTVPYTLQPRELRAWEDFLAENGIEGLATLDVRPTTGAVPRMTVRIYDDGGDGTTGFTLPVVMPDDALVAGESGLLVAPSDPLAARFNIGVRSLDDGAAMTIEVRDRTGATRHTRILEVGPNWFQQFPVADITGITLQAGDYISFHITRGSAVLYGASIDNVTNDPSVQVVTR